MSDDIFDFIKDQFNITKEASIGFHEIYGLTFVYKKKIVIIADKISAEIRPLGIIYEENEEYYFAPLARYNNINEIVKEYVENHLKK